MWNLLKLFSFVTIINSASAAYGGPFLLWGLEKLQNVHVPALETVDEKTLTSLYTEAKAVVIFLRNTTSKLDKDNFPRFRELITKNKWAYLTQMNLPADPVDYNSNVETIILNGPLSQQDVEISALYKDTMTIYGEGEVLGILANQADDVHYIYKRDAEDAVKEGDEASGSVSTPTLQTTTASPYPTEEEPMQANFIYFSSKTKNANCLLYTTSAPILSLESDEKGNSSRELKEHGIVTSDYHGTQATLIVGFKLGDSKVTLRFRFPISNGYWSLNSVVVEYKEISAVLPLVGALPTAPVGFSYSCSQSLIFRNGSNSLVLSDIQVQPLLGEQSQFSDAYNCVGFTTAPIWSGIFVSSILIFGTFVGILALMEIKTPNRFESSRNKQLTFTVQE